MIENLIYWMEKLGEKLGETPIFGKFSTIFPWNALKYG